MEQNKSLKKNNKPPLPEIIFAGAGALLFLASLIFITYKGISDNSHPPYIIVKQDSVLNVSSGYLVKITTENRGDEVVSNITISGELVDGDKTIESNFCEFDYIPSESKRKGGIFFSKDPGKYKLLLTPVGYEEP